MLLCVYVQWIKADWRQSLVVVVLTMLAASLWVATTVPLLLQVYCPQGTNRSVDAGDVLVSVCAGLKPNMEHTISVSAENGAGLGPAASATAITTCSINEQEMGAVSISLPDGCSIRY
jgi:hypothetical protein